MADQIEEPKSQTGDDGLYPVTPAQTFYSCRHCGCSVRSQSDCKCGHPWPEHLQILTG